MIDSYATINVIIHQHDKRNYGNSDQTKNKYMIYQFLYLYLTLKRSDSKDNKQEGVPQNASRAE